MTIDEAIKGIENVRVAFSPRGDRHDWEALQLGVEALKRIKELRIPPYIDVGDSLPGETDA